MKNFATSKKSTVLAVRLGFVISAVFLAAALSAPPASMQQDAPQSLSASPENISSKSDNVGVNQKGNVEVESVSPLSPDLVTVTTYPFTSSAAVALEDMSTGTTQLIAAGSDDGNSTLQNIGFDFWFDGVRFTQFGVNANGFARLGLAPTGTSFTNSIATTTNAPKIMPYWDDLWVGTNGNVRFKVLGATGSRKLVVEWNNMTIPRQAAVTTGAGTFQLWLYESSHPTLGGVIEFVYGSGIILNSANSGYSVGLQSGGATNFASVTTTGPTVSYAAANNTQTNAIASGTAYIFTPNVPAAPTGLSFAPVTQTSIQLNWTDNATNEVGYVIYRSLDGLNYSFVTQTAAGATSFNDSSLNPGTTYFYQVYAVTEGALSTALSGSQATAPAGNISSTAAGGNWSDTATWVGGVVPGAGDNVTIVTGATVTIDSSNALSVTIQTGATLQFEATTARTLTVGQFVTIDSGGTFQSNPAGTQTGHVLSVGTNLTNNGTLDFSTNTDTAGAGITFTGAANNTFSGTGATTDVRTITINKGTSNANILELTTSNFTVRGVNTDVAGFLTLTNGTFKISGTFTMTNRVFLTAAYVIPATGGIWLNNPNFTVAGTNTSTTSGNNGLFRLTQGVYTIGLAIADGFNVASATTIYIIEGGTLNANGRFDPQGACNYTQTAGTVNVAVVGNNRSAFGSFEIFSTAATFNMSGGTINIINPSTGATKDDFAMTGQTQNITGGQIVFGGPGAPPSSTYATPFGTTFAPNVVVNPTMTWNINNVAVFFRGTTVTNDGAITSTGTGARFDFANPTTAMSYSGSGTFGTLAVPFGGVGISSNSLFLITLNSPIVANRNNLFTGGFVNSGQMTLGNGGASSSVVQIGSAGLLTPGGSYDVSPVHNQGTAGQFMIYAQESVQRTTGVEINPTRALNFLSVTNTSNVSIAGGDLSCTSVAAAPNNALTLTSGRLITNAHTVILPNAASVVVRTAGHVDGNLRKNYSAAASKNFEVGTANGFSPVTVNVTAGTFPSDFTVKATQGPQPSVNPATSIQRYWTLTEGGDITADLTFNYLDPIDIMGTEANYKVIRVIGGTPVAFPASVVTPAANTATLAGVSNFSDWTVGEISAPTAAPATISGRITTASGGPLAGVTVHLSGARSARAVTDANGNYRFTNVETDNFYTVTPSRTNYRFSPGSRSFSLLANMTDAAFTGTLNDVITGNVIDTPEFFVRQHYLDFLGREPDSSGLDFWSNQIVGCGDDFNCIERRTINVSAAYFLSIEFQETGGLVDRLYRASYGRAPLFSEFMPDAGTIREDLIVGQTGWEELLANNKREFLEAWVQRAAFRAAYDNLSHDSYVDTLISHTGVSFTNRERAAFVRGLTDGTLTRAEVLQRIAQNELFVRAKFNEAFVRMQYFGYLRRDPDDSGFHFWLNKLNEFEGNFERAEMVRAFLVSSEYRDRFR